MGLWPALCQRKMPPPGLTPCSAQVVTFLFRGVAAPASASISRDAWPSIAFVGTSETRHLRQLVKQTGTVTTPIFPLPGHEMKTRLFTISVAHFSGRDGACLVHAVAITVLFVVRYTGRVSPSEGLVGGVVTRDLSTQQTPLPVREPAGHLAVSQEIGYSHPNLGPEYRALARTPLVSVTRGSSVRKTQEGHSSQKDPEESENQTCSGTHGSGS